MARSDKARELYDALRALEVKAKDAYNRQTKQRGRKYSRREVARVVDGRNSSLDRRLGEWLHEDWDKAKTPDPASSELLIAVVEQWSAWADEPCDARSWRTRLEDAQPPRSPLTPAQAHDAVFERHTAWIEDNILPRQLLDRQEELRELAAFCGDADLQGASAYAWWQAGPWAGKSALMSEFVLQHRPAGVEIVSYFIADRLGNNHRDWFLEGVARQLAALAARDCGPAGSRPEDLPEL